MKLIERAKFLFILLLAGLSVRGVSSAAYNYLWSPSALAAIQNRIDVNNHDFITLNCTNGVSTFVYIPDQATYDTCNKSTFGNTLGHCSNKNTYTLSIQVEAPIPTTPDYEFGSTYYFSSTHGTDCLDGIKLIVHVIDPSAPTTTSIGSTTSTTSTTSSTTNIATTGNIAVTVSNTPSTSQGTTTGTITDSITTESTAITTTNTRETLSTVNIGGGDLLSSLPHNGKAIFPAIAVFVLIVIVVIVLIFVIVCYNYKKASKPKDTVVEFRGSDEKHIISSIESVDNGHLYQHLDNNKANVEDNSTSVAAVSISSGHKRVAPPPPTGRSVTPPHSLSSEHMTQPTVKPLIPIKPSVNVSASVRRAAPLPPIYNNVNHSAPVQKNYK